MSSIYCFILTERTVEMKTIYPKRLVNRRPFIKVAKQSRFSPPYFKLIIMRNQMGEIAAGECNDKTPGNNGLAIEFYEFFWSEIGTFLVDSLNYTYFHGELSNSQKQAVITLIELKDKDRR